MILAWFHVTREQTISVRAFVARSLDVTPQTPVWIKP
jgi:hypothetical protein